MIYPTLERGQLHTSSCMHLDSTMNIQDQTEKNMSGLCTRMSGNVRKMFGEQVNIGISKSEFPLKSGYPSIRMLCCFCIGEVTIRANRMNNFVVKPSTTAYDHFDFNRWRALS